MNQLGSNGPPTLTSQSALRRFVTIALGNLSIQFFFFLILLKMFAFLLKEARCGFSLAHLYCWHHNSYIGAIVKHCVTAAVNLK